MTESLIVLPATTTYSPSQALHSALQAELKEVLVAGYDTEGRLVVRSSRMDRKGALWLCEQLRAHIFTPE